MYPRTTLWYPTIVENRVVGLPTTYRNPRTHLETPQRDFMVRLRTPMLTAQAPAELDPRPASGTASARIQELGI